MVSSAAVIREERRQRAVESLALSGTGSVPRLDRVTRMARALFGVAMSSVTVIDQDRALYPGRAGFDADDSARGDTPCHLVIDSGEVITTDDARLDPRFLDIAPFVENDLAFYIGHPLTDGSGNVVGSFCLIDKEPRRLSDDELAQFRDLAAWAQSELIADAESMRARATQQALLPEEPLVAGDVCVEGVCVPSLSVGGDYFDYGRVGDLVHVALGDVMGKGAGAAILGASTRSACRAAVPSVTSGPLLGEAVERIERAVLRDLQRLGSFVTYFHAVIDLASDTLFYVDAGAGLSLLLRADGRIEHLLGSAMPLGIVQQELLTESTTFLPGDRLVMVSDGVLDILPDPADWQAELARIVRDAGDVPTLLDRIREMSDDRVGRDDVTAVVLERRP
jgi:sigma-B regulation protein RsbU (phosphoserine phosphatase)